MLKKYLSILENIQDLFQELISNWNDFASRLEEIDCYFDRQNIVKYPNELENRPWDTIVVSVASAARWLLPHGVGG